MKNNLLHPYVSIHSLDLIHNSQINSFVIGASNGLFRQQTNLDVIITDQDEDFLIQSSQLKSELQLTTADLRFLQLFEDSQSGIFQIIHFISFKSFRN
jgi:ATP-dependent helicase/DNAse subunit B